MSPRFRSFLTQGGGFVLAALLLWLALRGLEARALREALATADYRWLLPLVGTLLAAHLLRAWRWTMLLDGLPPQAGTRRLRTPFAFAAVMIGYMVNYGAPRLGEVVRTTLGARRSGRSFSTVLGTVVLERLLDVLMLGLGLLTVPLVLGDRLAALAALFQPPGSRPLPGFGGVMIWIVLALLAIGVAVIGWRLVRPWIATRPEASWWHQRLMPLVRGFRDGLATLRTSPHRLGLVATTLAIWGLYAVAAWLPFMLLRSAAPLALTPLDAWAIMLIGSLGMIVPTPGGAGSYHYVTIQTLGLLYGMATVEAQIYAVFSHGAQLVLYAATGAVCLVLLAWRDRSRPPGAVHPQG